MKSYLNTWKSSTQYYQFTGATVTPILTPSREACCARLHDNISAITKNLIDTLKLHSDGSERMVQALEGVSKAVETMATNHVKMTQGKEELFFKKMK